MISYSTTNIIKTLRDKEISLFTLSDFAKLFNLDNQQTLYKKIARLEKQAIIKKLIKGKYQFTFNKADHFQISNFLYSPSYISLESALSFHSIITGFPYQITAITPCPTKTIILDSQEYKYTHISPNLFWGYEKKESFLLAQPEKALLDYLYLATKGLRNPNLDELDLSLINHPKLVLYSRKYHNKAITRLIPQLFS